MVNENEITQPELNLGSEESTAPVAEPQTEPATEAPTEAPAEPTSEVTASETTASETTATESSAPKAEDPVGTYPSSVEPEDNVQQTLQQTQQRLAQVEQERSIILLKIINNS